MGSNTKNRKLSEKYSLINGSNGELEKKMEEFTKELQIAKEKGLYRELRVIFSNPGREIIINGSKYINFSSNNYLDLASHPDLIKAAKAGLDNFGTGGTSSRLIAGTLEIHEDLERKLAKLKNTEACLLFPSGFQTNVGVMSSLVKEGDCIIMDKLNHASLWEGAKLSGARIFAYRHCDTGDLEKILKRAKSYRRRLIVTDTVFSMDGDLAPLKEIVSLAKQYNALILVDEAHATGIFGQRGAGLSEYFNVENEIDVIMGTLSKALGSQGGFICGKKELIDYLINFCRSFIYTTSLAPSSCAAAISALDIIEKEPERREKLLSLSGKFRKLLKKKGFDTGKSESQIIPLMTGPVDKTKSLSDKLFANGIFAPAIRPPTVPEGKARIRFSLTSAHNEEDIENIFEIL